VSSHQETVGNLEQQDWRSRQNQVSIAVRAMYGYQCEYCRGTVRARVVKREAFKHKAQFVILEDVTIGICDTCGNRYYSADLVRSVHDIATGARPAEKTEVVLVGHAA
jgi:YgiT-type zinc finger domain-containing protein